MGCFSTGGRLERRGMNLFVLIALLLFVIGGFNLYQHHQTLESCTRVQGLLVDLHHNPPMNGHSSTLYPVFEYTVDGTLYRQEHRYQAVDGSELAALAEDSDLPDGALNDLLKQAARAQPDFRIGESYPLLVSKGRSNGILHRRAGDCPEGGQVVCDGCCAFGAGIPV